MKIYDNLHDAYLGTLADVYDNPEHIISPRGQKTRECLDYQFRVLNPKVEYIKTKDPERNKTIASYSKKEFDIYEAGSNRVEDFIKISKFWGNICNPDGTLNSGYGYNIDKLKSHGAPYEKTLTEVIPTTRAEQARLKQIDGKFYKEETVMRTPMEWAEMCLRADKDTRQALLRIALPQHAYKGVKDFTCTLHGIYMIRNNKLNFSVNMRSNDLMLGLVFDMPWFIHLMYRMRDNLKDIYPDLEIGHYTHTVHSMHIYDRNEDAVLKMLGRK